MESTDSSTGSQQPQLPPGFRFHPTDEELVVHYLKKKAASAPLPVSIIAEVDLYKFDPWELPAKAAFGEQEWYFFSPRDRKYPNGARPNRAATSGYWKATGTDKPVMTGNQKVGVKKALVFYGGKPPKGLKTNWIMHEYRLTDSNKSIVKPPGSDKKASLRLDDWVLCRIYKKSNTQRPMDHDDHAISDMFGSIPPSLTISQQQVNSKQLLGLKPTTYASMLENEHMFDGMINSNDNINNLTMSNLLPMKRTLPTLYWNEEGNPGSSSTYTKRFMEENSDGSVAATRSNDDQSGSIASLFSQQPMLGSLGDGGIFRQPAYQLPGMNWYS